MQAEYRDFMNTYKSVCRYGPDQTISEGELDVNQRPLRISLDVFFRRLYKRREVEEVLKAKIQSSSDLICFVGPQGSGKTSTALQICADIKQSLKHRTFIVLIDIRTESVLKACETGSADAFQSFLRRRIVDEYLYKLFPYTREDDQQRLKLYEFLLMPADERRKPMKVFNPLLRLQDRAVRLIRMYEATEPSSRSYLDWLSENYLLDDRVRELIEELEDQIDIGHLAYAARFVHGINRQVLWIDNIDALPEALQPEAVHFVRKFHAHLSTYAATIISVREENVFRYEDLNDEGAPPFESRVLLDMPRNSAGHAVYPSVDVPVIKIDTVRSIISRRMLFARDLQRELHKELSEDVKVIRRKATEAELAKDEARDLIEETEVEAVNSLHPISDERYESLCELSDLIIQLFLDEKAIYLANNSLRDLLFIHRDCLGYFLRSPKQDAEPPEAIEYEKWYLSTLFYAWIRSTRRRYQMGTYDIIELTADWYEERARLGCFLPYLVITTTWNLCIELGSSPKESPYHVPRVRDVVARLSQIGFAGSKILQAIHDLYYQEGSRGNMIELRSRRLVRSWEEVDPDLFIYVTYRGKCVALYTSNSFGYLYECVRRFKSQDDEAELLRHPDISSTDDAAEELLPYIADIAQMHYAALAKIKEEESLGTDGWLSRYYDWFGLPQIQPYRRSQDIGRRLAGVRKALQFETLITSLVSYVRGSRVGSRFKELGDMFARGVDELDLGDGVKSLDFRGELGLPQRK